jgi:hypothetical protein
LPENLSHSVYYFETNPRLIAEENHYGVRLRVECAYPGAVRRSAPFAEHRIVDYSCVAEVDTIADFISRATKHHNNFIKSRGSSSLADNPLQQSRPSKWQELLWLPQASGRSGAKY